MLRPKVLRRLRRAGNAITVIVITARDGVEDCIHGMDDDEDDIPDEIRPFVQAINRLLQRIGILMGQQRRFIADAAHELRTPLTALSVQAQNLDQAGSLETMRERVRPLRAGIERVRTLTEQLLSLARLQAGTPETVEVDVSLLARALIAPFHRVPGTIGEGSGLGLAIAREAAEKLDGNLSLLDRPQAAGLIFRYRQDRRH